MVKYMLHILLNSPFNISISSLLLFSNKKDDLIGIQDGVFLGMLSHSVFKKIFCSFNVLYLLKEDIYARGLKNYIFSFFKIINYIDFVYLTTTHSKNITW